MYWGLPSGAAVLAFWTLMSLLRQPVGRADVLSELHGFSIDGVDTPAPLPLPGTCYVSQGLQAAGLGADPRLRPTVAWIKASQRQEPLPATGCPPGGWGWAMPSSWPDVDDTSLALATLAGFGLGADDKHVRAGISWLHQMRISNGSCGCFVRGPLDRTMPCSPTTSRSRAARRRTRRRP